MFSVLHNIHLWFKVLTNVYAVLGPAGGKAHGCQSLKIKQ